MVVLDDPIEDIELKLVRIEYYNATMNYYWLSWMLPRRWTMKRRLQFMFETPAQMLRRAKPAVDAFGCPIRKFFHVKEI